MSTGNEIQDIQSEPVQPAGDEGRSEWKGIWDTNRPSLRAALEGLGYQVVDLGIVSDEYELSSPSLTPLRLTRNQFPLSTTAHKEAILDAISRADILISTGGSSMGASDLFKPVLERHLGGTVHFGRVAVKPGKPTTFATVPFLDEEGEVIDKPVFGLPGNPASALVTFYLFVVPALRRMSGWSKDRCSLPRVKVEVSSKAS